MDIIGQDSIIQHMKNAIRMKKVSHAYIFEGEEGSGKKTLANFFAKTLQCESGLEEACNECTSCKLFDSGNHPDIKHIITQKKTGLGVDEIREAINTDIYIKPYRYPYKIYIVHEADLMTTQSQNALLKTIEEPPEYAVIILLAENINRFLPTVLSRCILIRLAEVPTHMIRDYLVKTEGVSLETAGLFASFSRGNIGKAKKLIYSESFHKMRQDLINVIDYAAKGNDLEVIQGCEVLATYKDEGNILLDLLLTWLRDLLTIKSLEDEKYVIHTDQYKTLLKQSGILSYNRIDKWITKADEAQKAFRFHINFQLLMETLLMNMEE